MESLTITSIEQLPAGISFLSKQLAELSERLNNPATGSAKSSTDELYSREETATRLKVSLPTLNEYTKDGKIKASRFGRRVLYKESDIQQALSQIKTSSAA